MILGGLRVAGRCFDLSSPWFGVQEFVSFLVASPQKSILLLTSGSTFVSLSLLRCSLCCLSPLGLPLQFLDPTLVSEVLLDFGSESLICLAHRLIVFGSVCSTEVSAPDKNGLVVASDSDDVLVPSREDNPCHVRAMTPAFF